jgi:addiction module RelE/StbE family toxin
MIQIFYHPSFRKSADKLPKIQQEKLAELIELLSSNPFNPLLHTKRLTEKLSGFFSFRITRDWRVFFRFLDQETIQLLRVKHRKDVYR